MGGTTTVYRELRAGLAAQGLRLNWVATAAKDVVVEGDGDDEGVLLTPRRDDPAAHGEALLDHLERGGYAAVIANVLADAIATNAMRYLATRLPRLVIVHNITPGTYAAARAIRDHVHAVVAVSPRIRDDLVDHHGFAADRVRLIANAIGTAAFAAALRRPRASGLRLLSLGRIEDEAKGSLWLPAILGMLADQPVSLTVAGDGPDRERLQRALRPFAERVRFVGPVPSRSVPAVMADHDVLLLPSRFEGLPLALVEAMAAGCVPVASAIRGVTDFVVSRERDGFLFPVGDLKAAAAILRRLVMEPELLARTSETARQAAGRRFERAPMAAAYIDLLTEIRHRPPAIAQPAPRGRWALAGSLRPGLRSYLPRPVKNGLRLVRERMAG